MIKQNLSDESYITLMDSIYEMLHPRYVFPLFQSRNNTGDELEPVV